MQAEVRRQATVHAALARIERARVEREAEPWAEWDRGHLARYEAHRARAEAEAEEWHGRLAEIRGERAAELQAVGDAAAERVPRAAAEADATEARQALAVMGDAVSELADVVAEREPMATHHPGGTQESYRDEFNRRRRARLAQLPAPWGWPKG